MSNESTTKIKADLSQLKKEFQDAQRHIRLVTSEFKASTASMDKWTDNADGLGAKIKQLNGILDAETTKLESLEKQYELVAKEQGKNSKGAQELAIKINNQKAAIDKVKSSIDHYTDKLNDLKTESNQVVTASDKLKSTISDQEKELANLKQKYQDVVLVQGKSSDAAKILESKISSLSGKISENKTRLNEAAYAADDLSDELKNSDNAARNASDGFTIMKGALADLLADGISKVIGGLKDFVVESDSAYKKFQAQTGATTEEMNEFQEEIDGMYMDAFGESLTEVGDSMAYVKQVTKEVDPSKIRELTENAITLEETFGSDFNETIRGVNNLMTHFGIDSEEAFDLFAQGSQLGLDYTGELGDNIAEYGGNFKQAGYSAEEYFQLLVNGSENGAYNLDKVNDSINEVKNRIADGTLEDSMDKIDKKTGKVVEGTGGWSEKTETLFKKWKKGKGTMKDVIDSVVKDINNCENEQDALNMAAIAFGTMGEDANLKVVKSLTTTGDSFDNVKGKMEEIKEIRYDDIGTQFKELGRKLQMNLLKPLAEKAFPYFEKLGDYAIENIDEICSAATTLGAVLGSVFVINKTANFISSLKTIGTSLGIVKTATDGAKASTLALNTAWLTSPVTWLVAGIAALTGGLLYLNKKQEESIEKEYGLSQAQQKTIESAKNLRSEYDQMNSSRNEAMNGISTEYGYLEELKDEYNSLIDKNGKVKKGYEDRANFIINQLAESLGVEKDQIQELIEKNGQLGESIDQIIQKKQAEATLNANEEAYTQAIQKRSEALSTYQSSLTTLEEAEAKYAETKKSYNNVMETYNELLRSNPQAATEYYLANAKIIDANESAKESYDKAKKGVEDAESAYVGYNTTIQNYENLSSAIIAGDVEKIKVALQNMQNGFITAENGTKTSLENQVKNMQKTYEDLKAAIEAGTPGVTQAQVDAAKQMVDKAEEELAKLEPKAKAQGEKSSTAHADGVKSKAANNETAGKTVSDSTNKGLGSADTKSTGAKKGEEYKQGVDSKKGDTEKTGQDVSDALNKGMSTADTKSTGSNKGSEFNSGAKNQSGKSNATGVNLSNTLNKGLSSANTTGTGVLKVNQFNTGVGSVSSYGAGQGRANDAKDGMASVDASGTGNNFTQGFVNGLSSGEASLSLWDKAWNLGKKALSALKEAIKEGSPSKETYQSGNFFVLGFVNAIGDGVKLTVKKVKTLGQQALTALNEEMENGINAPTINGFKSSMAATRNAVKNNNIPNTINNRTTNVYNTFNQNNYSPKALSRLDIYRQTRNQLNFAKGV